MLKKSDILKRFPYIIIVILVALLVYTQLFKPEPIDDTETEYLSRISELEAKDAAQVKKIVRLTNERDSAFMAVRVELVEKKNEIKAKHEVIRNDIVLLTDSESVQLLSKNLGVTRNN